MTEKDKELLEEQRKRRKRITKIKNGIIITIATWMIVSLISIIVLLTLVISARSRITKLEDLLSGVVVEDTSSADSPQYTNVVTGIDTVDNFYQEGDERKVYLTFNCVPGDNTNLILDELAKADVKATFFVSGDETGEYADVYKRIVDEGHTIAMHSYSNTYSDIYGSQDDFTADLDKISNYITETTGVTPTIYRFPNGSRNEISDVDMVSLVAYLNSRDITYFDWNVSAGDAAASYTVDDVVNNITTGVVNYKTSVVLLHDDINKSTTAEAIAPTIEALKNMGATILPIDENTYNIQYIKADSVE